MPSILVSFFISSFLFYFFRFFYIFRYRVRQYLSSFSFLLFSIFIEVIFLWLPFPCKTASEDICIRDIQCQWLASCDISTEKHLVRYPLRSTLWHQSLWQSTIIIILSPWSIIIIIVNSTIKVTEIYHHCVSPITKSNRAKQLSNFATWSKAALNICNDRIKTIVAIGQRHHYHDFAFSKWYWPRPRIRLILPLSTASGKFGFEKRRHFKIHF